MMRAATALIDQTLVERLHRKGARRTMVALMEVFASTLEAARSIRLITADPRRG